MILIYISLKIIPSVIHAVHISRHPIYSTATILYLCMAVALLTPAIHALTFIHMDFVPLIMAARAYINYDLLVMFELESGLSFGVESDMFASLI